MQPNNTQDYKQLLTDVIKKQIVILGPDITLSKARNVKGLTVADDGTVTAVAGSAQEVTQALIDQFVQLSGLIVKKTMEPLLALSQTSQQAAMPVVAAVAPPVVPQVSPAVPAQQTQQQPTQPATPTPEAIPSAAEAQAAIQAAINPGQAPASPAQTPPVAQQSAQSTTPPPLPEPAKNPLAA